ncbi:MAG TPA: acyl-CoA dehydrogenase family protein [Burkholderiales bacterium]|nr:acyl-CoA dehydrogenase family protein [Burkholderiales bacterium]
MNDRLDDEGLDTVRFTRGTHEVTNQPPPLVGANPWTGDPVLRATVAREGGGWVDEQAASLGELVGSERMQLLAAQANRILPELRTHDRVGNRIDEVDYHPAYHELMQLAFTNGLHSLAWTAAGPGGFVARAALNFLWNQGENGTSCPVTMTFAGVQVLRQNPEIARDWESKLVAPAYDPRPLPVSEKTAATVGMAMTEKQGGSDLRANQTRARYVAHDLYELRGHKWFCSAPMSDGFLTLALLEGALTCFFVPRSLADGTRNRFYIQRLKDKVGNRSNASAEIEYDGTLAWLVGDPGRGIATLIEMAHLTRFDIVVAAAGMMRAALHQALHHCAHRVAFGRTLVEQPLMQNVLADLAIESEAAMLIAFRLARAFDRMGHDEQERRLTRIITPIAKYWLCKRLPMLIAEAMECLGGNGYVEEGPLGRLYREAPLNGIWEGSGNVICLDVLRAMQKAPDVRDALFRELGPAIDADSRVSRYLDVIGTELGNSQGLEGRARRVTETLGQILSAALLVQHAPKEVVDAFCMGRLGRDGGKAFGTLPGRVECAAIIERARLRT